MTKYYLFWIGESADELRAPSCELATTSAHSMVEFCKQFIDNFYTKGQYVVMSVRTINGLADSEGKRTPLFIQTTCSVSNFILECEEK